MKSHTMLEWAREALELLANNSMEGAELDATDIVEMLVERAKDASLLQADLTIEGDPCLEVVE